MKIPDHQAKLYLLEKQARDLYIVNRLKENQTLLQSEKFEEIESFLHELLTTVIPILHKISLIKKSGRNEKKVARKFI